jgi:hypothetical protein
MRKKLISFYGLPNTGKTTLALGLTYELKIRGYKCDFIPEFARELHYVYGGKENLPNQLVVTGTQIQKCVDALKVQDIVVTDSDPVLGALYLPELTTIDRMQFGRVVGEILKNAIEKLNGDWVQLQMLEKGLFTSSPKDLCEEIIRKEIK